MQDTSVSNQTVSGCSCRTGNCRPGSAEKPVPLASGTRQVLWVIVQLGLIIFLALIAYLVSQLPQTPILPFVSRGLFLLAYALAGYPVFKDALRGIRQGDIFNEMFLMIVASLGAFLIGAMEEAIGVMVFYRVGEFFMDKATRQSRASIQGLLALQVDVAHVRKADVWVDIAAADVQPGDRLLVKPGERIPVDGRIVDGNTHLDTRAMTGEALPRPAVVGDEVASGAIVMEDLIQIECLRIMAESSAARILQLVQQASEAKAKTELFITRFARWYTPAVLIIATLIATLPPIINLLRNMDSNWAGWLYRALVLLVISCPCALVLSVPLGYFAGLGGAARRGILIKGARVFDALADASVVVFDKTGTLSDGLFRVIGIRCADGITHSTILRTARLALAHSLHPLALAIRNYRDADSDSSDGETANTASTEGRYRELAGRGVRVEFAQSVILAGNRRLLVEAGVMVPAELHEDTVVHIAQNGQWLGSILAGDSPKTGSAQAIRQLRKHGIKRIAMLTGDTVAAAQRVGQLCGIEEIHAALLPGDKLKILETMIGEKPKHKRQTVLFVGDGTNDAPVLARADAGLAMGGSATDAAIESADVVLLNGNPELVVETLRRARRIRAIITSNIILALGVKLVFMIFGGMGLAAMWEAVIADVGVALLAILNASRALR